MILEELVLLKNPKDSATGNVANLATARTTNAIIMASGGKWNISSR